MNQAEVSGLLCVGLHDTNGGGESYATECPKMNQVSSHETAKVDVVMATPAMYSDHSKANACLDGYQHTGMMAAVQPVEEARFVSTQHFEGIVADSEEESLSSSPETSSTTNYGYMEQNLQNIYNELDEMVDKEGPVMLNPEFVLCDKTLHHQPHLTFSSDGFKIEHFDWDSCEDDEMVALYWDVSDIICIGCKWTQSVESALITLLVGSSAETRNSGLVWMLGEENPGHQIPRGDFKMQQGGNPLPPVLVPTLANGSRRKNKYTYQESKDGNPNSTWASEEF